MTGRVTGDRSLGVAGGRLSCRASGMARRRRLEYRTLGVARGEGLCYRILGLAGVSPLGRVFRYLCVYSSLKCAH